MENGADIELEGPGVRHKYQKATPLMAACWWQHSDIVEYLLSLGAQVDRQNLEGMWY